MKEPKQIITAIIILLTIITATSLIKYKLNPGEYSGNYEITIWTDKETYTLEEPIHTVLVFTNKADHQIDIDLIYELSFSGNSIHDPHPVTEGVNINPGEKKISIPANGNISFIEFTFNPTYPGPFKISGLGVSKTVNVTGYKEVSLNSTGISLEVQTSQDEFQIGDEIEVSLVIRNSNPYPVRVPVYQKVTESAVPLENPRHTIFISWAMPYFEIEANSTRTTLRDKVTLRLPFYSKYWYVDGQQAFIEFEVAPN